MPLLKLNSSGSLGTTAHDSLAVVLDLRHLDPGNQDDEIVQSIIELAGIPQSSRLPPNYDSYDKRARDIYSQLLTAPNGKPRAKMFIACLSAMFHELRHVHDLLSTVYGQEILCLLLNCYQNSYGILEHLADWLRGNGAGSVPLPLRGAETQLDGFPEEALRILQRYWNAWDVIESHQRAPKEASSRRTPTILLELMAVNAQLGFAHDLFGPDGWTEVHRLIASSSQAETYLQCHNEVGDMFLARGVGVQEVLPIVNYLAWCALNSTYNRNSAPKLLELHPVVYFEALVEHVSRSGCNDLISCRKLVQSFCDSWDLAPPEQVVADYRAMTAQRFRLNRLANMNGGFATLLRQIRGCYAGFQKSFCDLTRIAENASPIYHTPHAYCWGVVGGLFPAVLLIAQRDTDSTFGLTYGRRYLSTDKWANLALAATLTRILASGVGLCGDLEMENTLIRLLRRKGWGDVSFRFRDSSDLFAGLDAA